MWLGDKWRQWQEAKAQRYLSAYPQLGLDILRHDHALASAAFEHFAEIQAAQGKEGPHRESLEWPTYGSLGYGARSPILTTLPKPTPVNIRAFSNQPPARRAVNVLSNPVLELPFTITIRRPLGMKAHDTMPEPTAEQHTRIVAATEMFIRPNNEQDGREFLEMILEDLIVLGAGPFEAEENTTDDRPLFLWPVDAQSIRVNMRWQPGSDLYHYSQGRGFLFGTVGIGDDIKFMDDQLCYPKLNPRTSQPFGLGYMEVAFDAVNSFMGAVAFATRRASNETPSFGLFLGENMTPEQVRRFQHYWINEIEGAGKIPIIGGGRQPSAFTFTQGTGKDPLWIQWQEWLVRIIAMSFGVSPMRLSLERDVNRSTATQSATDDWSTVAPVANTLRNAFTHWVLWKRLGWTDLEFQWQVKSSDELRQAQIIALQYEANAITIDEIRQIYERPPLPDGLGDMTKTAYESSIAAALAPEPAPATGAPSTKKDDEQASSILPRVHHITGVGAVPFTADEVDMLSPSEAAFLRELMSQSRYGGDLEDVAG